MFVPGGLDSVPMAVVDSGRVVRDKGFSAAEVVAQVYEAVLDADREEVAGRSRLFRPATPQQQSRRRRRTDTHVYAHFVADYSANR